MSQNLQGAADIISNVIAAVYNDTYYEANMAATKGETLVPAIINHLINQPTDQNKSMHNKYHFRSRCFYNYYLFVRVYLTKVLTFSIICYFVFQFQVIWK